MLRAGVQNLALAGSLSVGQLSSMSPTEPDDIAAMSKYPYSALVGCLLYCTITRGEISCAVSELSRFLSNPGMPHWNAAIHCLRYLATHPNLPLIFSKPALLHPGNELNGWADSSWADDKDNRRSRYGYIVFYAGCPISWKSKLPKTPRHSSAEAEYFAQAELARELAWLRNLLSEIGHPQTSPTPMFCDSTSAIRQMVNPIISERNKHVELKVHLVRNFISAGKGGVHKVPTTDNIADLYTKNLDRTLFTKLSSRTRGGIPIPHSEDDFKKLSMTCPHWKPTKQ